MKQIIFLLLAAFSMGWFYRDICKRVQWIRQGGADNRRRDGLERWAYVLKTIIFHRKIRRYRLFGIAHLMIMWGFAVLMISNLDLLLTGLFPAWGWGGHTIEFSYVRDIFIVLALTGLWLCLLRRFVRKPDWLKNNSKHLGLLIYILVIVLTEFFYYAADAALNGGGTTIVAVVMPAFSIFSGQSLEWISAFFWWVHMVLTFLLLIYLPRSKHLHLVFAPFNTYWHDNTPMGALLPAASDSENKAVIGPFDIFTWKQRLDAFSCVRCGRCNGSCPVFQSGVDLKPKRINGRLRKLMEPVKKKKKVPQTLEDILPQEALWSCVTCGACMDACPISCEHLSVVMGIRRRLIMDNAPLPSAVDNVLGTIEAEGSPWGNMADAAPVSFETVGSWTHAFDGIHQAEYLYFQGCAARSTNTARETARAFIHLLTLAGVDFTVMEDSGCCGETARRLGHEALFRKAAEGNIRLWQHLGVKKIIVTCPHCYNTLKNEYPLLGSDIQVIAHPVFLADLLYKKQLVPVSSCSEETMSVTIHDSCYLGRFNGIWQELRQILGFFPKIKITEMSRSKNGTSCCGAGGGRFWTQGEDNLILSGRVLEANATGVEMICTSCPYCQIGFQNETIKMSESIKALDIVQIMEQHSSSRTSAH